MCARSRSRNVFDQGLGDLLTVRVAGHNAESAAWLKDGSPVGPK
jgi:hypothetical protein